MVSENLEKERSERRVALPAHPGLGDGTATEGFTTVNDDDVPIEPLDVVVNPSGPMRFQIPTIFGYGVGSTMTSVRMRRRRP